MMKKLFNRKAFTLLETILAVAMIATISMPLLTVFLQSVKTDASANDVFNENYISQGYIESLDALTYKQAITTQPNHQSAGDYYLTAKIEPYGTANEQFGTQCSYAHLIIFNNETALIVLPDGKYRALSSVPNYIFLTTYNDYYAVYVNNDEDPFMVGYCGYENCMLVVNGMQKSSSSQVNIYVDSHCKISLYSQLLHTSDFVLHGSDEIYEDIIKADTSLIHVTTYIYDSATSTEEVGTSESYVNIRNW